MAASPSAVAVDPRLLKYDVFISFRGETRNSFTSHLYSALCQKHIKPYIDEVSLEKGDDIERALPMAIKESVISIIIFSENYASSRWCLDELVDILKCKKEQDQIVLTIFYGIDPSHIRHQKGTYAAAFVKHQERFKDKMDKVEEWRQALTRAADLSGWNSQGKSESVLVQEVVENVMRKLKSISSTSIDDLRGLFGIRRQLCDIESLLCFESPNVRILGIWGMGGIGKTTLARVVFKCFSNRFEGRCFLESVREQSQRKGLVELEKEVFSKLLGEKDPDVSNHFVNVRLSRTKALLVLDDVDNFEQLERLAGDRDRFGPGSKIIVTSRDLQVLNQLIDVRYKVQALGLNEASQLFYLKAFKENSCRTGYEEISDRVIEYTKGHPLALKVLGASVFGILESIEDWGKEFEKLKRIPHYEIQAVLKRSYDALDAEEKGLFLDIACFFKGERRDFVEGILEGKPIGGLVCKSLITIEDGEIHMHDLIQEMGRNIVLRSTEKLGERSRLWIAEDVSDVLENNKGTEAIEGIYLPWIYKVLHLRRDVFEEMCKLRLLRMSLYKVCIDGDLKYLPNSLRYLHWEDYPGKSLPSNFKAQNLVELHMPNSELEQLWDGVQKLGSLKHINLHNSRFLTKIPDLSLAPKLESINLSSCQSLTTLPKVCGNITKLVLKETAFKELPSSIESLENLLVLDLGRCYNLKSLPKLPRNIEVLVLDYLRIEQIPSSLIECLWSLRQLSLRHCKSLSSLYLNNYKHLEFIPKNLCKLTRLRELSLSSFSKLGSFRMLSGFCSLTHLYVNSCNIREIPDWLGSLTSLTGLDLGGNPFGRIPESIGMLHRLTELYISNCKNLQSLPASVGMLHKLKELDISDCKNLQSLPASIGMLYKLKELDISDCKNLQSIPELPLFIEFVKARGCSSLEMVLSLRSTLTLGRWLDKYDIGGLLYSRIFSFVDCINLGEDAINNIFREFVYKVFCTATTPPELVSSAVLVGDVVVCYPTKEIPGWFNNQSEGSSITITLLPNWYNRKKFLGFVISVVVGEDKGEGENEEEEEVREVGCDLHLMTNKDCFTIHVSKSLVESCLDHIVMWYKYFDHSEENFEKYQEASLEFKTENLKVKRCGVRMLYLKDAVEESDNIESWRTDVNDSDTSEDDFQSRGSDDDDQSCGSDDDFQSCGSGDNFQSCGS